MILVVSLILASFALEVFGDCNLKFRPPDIKPCPETMTDDGNSNCWRKSYGRGVGRVPDKAPCPSGLRDDGTSCWSDAHIFGKGCCCTLWGCCDKCKAGYNDDGCTCRKIDVGIKMTLFDRYRCHDDEEMYGHLCYPKCGKGTEAVGCCLCLRREDQGTEITAEQRKYCKDGAPLVKGQCVVRGQCSHEQMMQKLKSSGL